MDDNTNTNNNSGKNTDNVVDTVNVDSRHNNKGANKHSNILDENISLDTSEDDEDNNHNVNIATKTKEKTTHSTHDQIAASTTVVTATAAEASLHQIIEKKRIKKKNLSKKMILQTCSQWITLFGVRIRMVKPPL